MSPRILASWVVAFAACRPATAVHQTHLTGTVVLVAPIVGAPVTVYRLSSFGQDVVSSTVTDANGVFDLDAPATEGDVLIEVSDDSGNGATSKEPLSQKPIGLSLTDKFDLLISNVKLGTTRAGLVVSPWSTLVAARAQWDVTTNKKTFSQALADNTALFVAHFGGRAFFDSVPLDPTAGPTNGLSTQAMHGFATTALAGMGIDLSHRLSLSPSGLITTVSLTQLLAEDVGSDGVFDNRGQNGRPLTIIDAQGTDKEFTRAELGAALGSFITSGANASGVGLPDLTAIIASISTDNSVMYGGSLTQSAGPGPTITLSSPSTTAASKDQALIIGQAVSPLGVAGVQISLDGVTVGDGGVRQSTTAIVWSFAQPVANGFHTLIVSAEDASGTTSSLPITFSSDDIAPVVSFASCLAFDDSARAQPAAEFVSGTIDWRSPIRVEGCDASSLSSTANPPFMFVTYADLADASATSSSISVLVQDGGTVATPSPALLVTASLFKGTNQIGDSATVPASPDSGAVRVIPLSTENFGPAFGSVSHEDVLELRVSATDTEGNVGTSSYFFRLDLLPAPFALKYETLGVPPTDRIEGYSFDAGNADNVFAASPPYGVFVESQSELKNPSAHAQQLSVSLGSASVAATVTEWTGLVAAQASTFEMANNSDTQFDVSPESVSQAGLTTPTLTDFWNTCVNTGSDYGVSQASVPANPNVLAISNGQESCPPANNYLVPNTLTATTAWRVALIDVATGLPLVANGAGEVTIAPQGIVKVIIGINVPQFPSQAYPACTPLYTDNTNISSSLLKASSFADQVVYFSNGIIPSRTVYSNASNYSSFAWTGRGAIDCTGFSCGHAGCRTDANQTLLRVQGAIQTTDIHESNGNWLREVKRNVAELALSIMHATSAFDVTGSAQLATYGRTEGNAHQWTQAVTIPSLSPVAVHARNGNQPPDTGIRYTKGVLP